MFEVYFVGVRFEQWVLIRMLLCQNKVWLFVMGYCLLGQVFLQCVLLFGVKQENFLLFVSLLSRLRVGLWFILEMVVVGWVVLVLGLFQMQVRVLFLFMLEGLNVVWLRGVLVSFVNMVFDRIVWQFVGSVMGVVVGVGLGDGVLVFLLFVVLFCVEFVEVFQVLFVCGVYVVRVRRRMIVVVVLMSWGFMVIWYFLLVGQLKRIVVLLQFFCVVIVLVGE